MTQTASPYHVWARPLWAALDLARLAGISEDGLFEGMPFDSRSVRSRRRVDWDDFCVLGERLEERCGSPEECQRLLSTSYHRVLPEFRSLVGGVVSPLTFARTIIEGLSPLAYEGCAFSLQRLSEDTVRVELRLRPGARPSLTFFRATIGELQALPRHLGLPPAIVTAEVGPTHGDYVVVLPPSRSLADRALRAARDGALRLVLEFTPDGDPLTLSLGNEASSCATNRLRTARHAWRLTARQVEVLEQVVEGASNKEIADALGCAENTVELHVTGILRRANVPSRARLMARFWSKL